MPRYHFNLHDHRYVPDEEGALFADVGAAKRQAVKLAAAILAGWPEEALASDNWRVEVTDEGGRLLFTVGLTMITAPTVWDPARQ